VLEFFRNAEYGLGVAIGMKGCDGADRERRLIKAQCLSEPLACIDPLMVIDDFNAMGGIAGAFQ
jgi:hypothetical protein